MQGTALIVLLALASTASGPSARTPPPLAAEHRYLDAAREAARWIAGTRVRTEHGVTWPADPARPEDLATSLYSGSPGVVLFLLDLARATGESAYLEDAVAGADHLLATLRPAGEDAGLYTGLSGQCFTLHRAWEASGLERFRSGARRCMDGVVAAARPAGAGVEWSPTTDIIGGSAGIGLTLLWAHRTLAVEGALDTAVAAADRLLEVAIPSGDGVKWAMSPDVPRLMPNFSHGTAGIAYFLATVHGATGEERFLRGALAGGRYLQAVADTDGEACLVFHHEPEGEDLYYLSWCHGPAGTGRTFYRLHEVTGDREWLDWTRRAAAGIERSGVPRMRPPGFWNNVGRCCGNAGVADFYLDLYGVLGERGYLSLAREMAEDLLERASRDGDGLRWVQAEHRVQPDNLAAQTGYMQGAAGIGSLLLRLHAVESGAPSPVVLPDSPFGGS